MKKLMMLILSGVSALILSGCGGGSGDVVSGIDEVYIYDLNQGYLVTAEVASDIDNPTIEIQFCPNSYDIYDYNSNSNSYSDYGSFSTENSFISFYSDAYLNYSYDLDTWGISDDFLVVGLTYPVDGDDWRITNIELIDCI